MGTRAVRYGGLAVALLAGTLLAAQTGFLPVTAGDFEERTVRVTDCEGTVRATATVGVAESFAQRYVGLSRTESLGPDEGLLFPFEEEASHRIEMRNTEFGLDVIYVSSDGEIGKIETLAAPDDSIEYYLTYESTTGVGRYVIELPAGWSEANDVSAGDCVTGLP